MRVRYVVISGMHRRPGPDGSTATYRIGDEIPLTDEEFAASVLLQGRVRREELADAGEPEPASPQEPEPETEIETPRRRRNARR